MLQEFNIPKFLLGPAGQALSRLIGGGGDYLSAHIEGWTKDVRNRTDGRTAVAKALAGAATKALDRDSELADRALALYLPRELRRQTNKEAIAQRTLKLLQVDPLITESLNESSTNESQTIEDDWLNVFERYAEDASSDKLRELWSRILAGEIRKPRSISLKTIRVLSELDQDVANLLTKYSLHVLNDSFILRNQSLSSQMIEDFLILDEMDITSSAINTLSKNFTLEENALALFLAQYAIMVAGPEGHVLRIPVINLGHVGKQILRIIPREDNIEVAKEIVHLIPKHLLTRIAYCKIIKKEGDLRYLDDGITLWAPDMDVGAPTPNVAA